MQAARRLLVPGAPRVQLPKDHLRAEARCTQGSRSRSGVSVGKEEGACQTEAACGLRVHEKNQALARARAACEQSGRLPIASGASVKKLDAHRRPDFAYDFSDAT